MYKQVWKNVDQFHPVPFLLPSCAFCEEIEALSTDLPFFEKAARSQDTPWSDWRLPLNQEKQHLQDTKNYMFIQLRYVNKQTYK